jgi:hypothetical protein
MSKVLLVRTGLGDIGGGVVLVGVTGAVTSNTTTAVVHHNFSSPSSVMNSNYKIEPLASDKTNKENPDKRPSPPPDYEDDLVNMTNTMSVSTNMKPYPRYSDFSFLSRE